MGSSIIFKTLKLQTRISYYSSFLIFLIVTLAGLLFYITISDALQTQIGNRALYLAETTASRGDVIEAFHTDNPSESLQKISNDIMVAAKATYVVIGDKNGIRYTHPLADRIGKSMVGDDNDKALINGESYISIADGSMGQSIRGKRLSLIRMERF